MKRELIVLKLVLKELGFDKKHVNNFGDRKDIQKAIYLSQRAGLRNRYRFGWYVYGPYSPDLTRAYYALAEENVSSEALGKRLKPTVIDNLKKVEKLILSDSRPKDLGQSDWLELLASYDYLRQIAKKDHRDAIATLNEKKRALAPYAEHARSALIEAGLLERESAF